MPAGFHAGTGGFESESGFLRVFEKPSSRIELRGTRIKDPKIAHQKMFVDFAAIRRQFEPRGNPYAGQITELVICDKKFTPQDLPLEPAKGKDAVTAILGGVGARRTFGACDAANLESWGLYFNYFDEPRSMVVEARLFQSTKDRDVAKRELGKTAHVLLDLARAQP